MNSVAPIFSVQVNGRSYSLSDSSPTGQQVLAAASLHPVMDHALVLWPASGPTREIGLDEVLKLPSEGPPLQFFAHRADGIRYFSLNEERFAWAGPLTATQLRVVGRIAEDLELWLERQDEPDLLLAADAQVDLKASGVERLYTKKGEWKLDIQGEIFTFDRPRVLVRDALVKAGIDTSKEWLIIFKVKGEPKDPVELSSVLDLRKVGIERLWLRPKKINNGEGQAPVGREFSLLPKDGAYLEKNGFNWSTRVDQGRRWLLIKDYQLPVGFSGPSCSIAIEIPLIYPSAEIDMFYCHPFVARTDGIAIPQADVSQVILGTTYQRWSRHRDPGTWKPEYDSVITHLGLIEEALCREVGQ